MMKNFGASILCILLIATSSSQQQDTSDRECRRTLDLVFVIDGSNSLGTEHFQVIIDTISEAVDVLHFGEEWSRVGAVLYSAQIDNVIDLQTDNATFKELLKNMYYPDQATRTDLGIQAAVEILTRNRRDYNATPITIMIVTDGESSKPAETSYQALVASSRGIDIWGVGVSVLADMAELASITTNGMNQTFHIESFEALPDRLGNLTKLVCNETEFLTTFEITERTTPYTGPSTTPSVPTTPEPVKNDTNDPEELCKNNPSIGGVGHVLYPGDCTKVLQCYHNPHTNKTLIVTRQCPTGQFWDQNCLKCQPSWTVDCPYDQCKRNSCDSAWQATETYPMEGVCGGFWSCDKERSYPKCCPPCYSYVPGYGCKFGTTCWDKCGPSEECVEGLGVCEKYPVWVNDTTYAIASNEWGLPETTCRNTEFGIIDCTCLVRHVDIFMHEDEECTPYYTSSSSIPCASDMTTIPVKQLNDAGPITFKFELSISDPEFEITTAPVAAEGCDSVIPLRVWADEGQIHAQLGDPSKKGPKATVLFKEVTGQLEVLTKLHQGILTLAVRQGNLQVVSSVKAPSVRFCSDCEHSVSFGSDDIAGCSVNKIEVYNCKPEVSDIYDMN